MLREKPCCWLKNSTTQTTQVRLATKEQCPNQQSRWQRMRSTANIMTLKVFMRKTSMSLWKKTCSRQFMTEQRKRSRIRDRPPTRKNYSSSWLWLKGCSKYTSSFLMKVKKHRKRLWRRIRKSQLKQRSKKMLMKRHPQWRLVSRWETRRSKRNYSNSLCLPKASSKRLRWRI